MNRFLALAAWFPVSLAMVLATVAILAVPERAFADDGSDYCTSYCASQCDPMDKDCLKTCGGYCYAGYYDCDFCKSLSGGDYYWCMAGCNAAPVPCCELSLSDPKNCNLYGGVLCTAGSCDLTAPCAICACLKTINSSVPCGCQ